MKDNITCLSYSLLVVCEEDRSTNGRFKVVIINTTGHQLSVDTDQLHLYNYCMTS